jgi:hypothetical protein
MARFVLVSVALGLLLLAGCARERPAPNRKSASKRSEAEDRTTYEIKFRTDQEGDRSRIAEEKTETFDVVSKAGDGKTIEDRSYKSVMRSRYVQEVLEKGTGRKAERVRRVYDRARTSEDGKPETLPYEGKTVLIEKKRGAYVFTVEGEGTLIGKEARFLRREFKDSGRDDDPGGKWLPGHPVAVGQTWKIDARAFFKAGEDEGVLDFDLEGAKGEGRLVKAYKKDGRQYGALEIRIEVPLKAMREEGTKITFRPGARVELAVTLDGCIDGTVSAGTGTAKFSMSGTGTTVVRGTQLVLTIDRRVTRQRTGEPISSERVGKSP